MCGKLLIKIDFEIKWVLATYIFIAVELIDLVLDWLCLPEELLEFWPWKYPNFQGQVYTDSTEEKTQGTSSALQ